MINLNDIYKINDAMRLAELRDIIHNQKQTMDVKNVFIHKDLFKLDPPNEIDGVNIYVSPLIEKGKIIFTKDLSYDF